ncbi:MAG: fatty acid desaturase [Aestuariivirgaceae bacterium]
MEKEVTHKEALMLISGSELAGLRILSDVPGVLHLAGHLLILAVTGYAVLHATGIFWLAASIAHGIVLVFLFTPLHESIHGTAFRSPWLNAVVSHLAGYLLLLPPRYFRYFHFAHHRFTQDPQLDPELELPKPRTWLQYAWHLSGIPYWKGAVLILFNHAMGRKIGAYVPAPAAPKLIYEARLFLIAYAITLALGLAFKLNWILYLWVFPALLGQPFLRAYLLAEHAACPLVADMLANTRTTFCNAAIRFLAWNMPHHTAHHALPTVPFHRLPGLTRLLQGRLKTTAQGYVEAHRQIRQDWMA